MSGSQLALLDASLRYQDEQLELPTPGVRITSPVTRNTYLLADRIGEGTFGIVFAARDTWGEEVVAKLVKPHGASFAQVQEKTLKELQALVHVRHPKIVQVYDAFCFKGGCYIISERCDRTLAELIEKPNFRPEAWFGAVARCVLQAVHFAHVQGVVHCDIHARNVFLRFIADELLPEEHKAVTFKLGDFGLARALTAVQADGTFLNAIRPPEAVNPTEFGDSDHRVDIFQTGLLLLQTMYGELLTFSQDDILDGLPGKLARQLSETYAVAVERMLRRHVEYRTQTAMDAWLDLINNGLAPVYS